MRTAPSLCALGAGIACAYSGLAIVSAEPYVEHTQHQSQHQQPRSRYSRHERHSVLGSSTRESSSSPSSRSAMTAAIPANRLVLDQSLQPEISSYGSFAFPVVPPHTTQNLNEETGLQHENKQSSWVKSGRKRLLVPRASFSLEGISTQKGDKDQRFDTAVADADAIGAAKRTSWMRRLSSSKSTSRDGDRYSISRPNSAYISNSNTSISLSRLSQSTPRTTPTPSLSSNKLVKRSSSIQSTDRSSPLHPAGSRIPRPVFRRPATSYERSARSRGRSSVVAHTDDLKFGDEWSESHGFEFRHYFVAKCVDSKAVTTRRRSSSGIPNPVRRVYPDRKYTPVLVPASWPIMRAAVEMDEDSVDEFSETELSKDEIRNAGSSDSPMSSAIASSPTPAASAIVPDGRSPRRSFSIGDLLSTTQQPFRRQFSLSARKPSAHVRTGRKASNRTVSAPLAAMGGTFSAGTDHDFDRPAKRRETSNSYNQRKIHSSSTGDIALDHTPGVDENQNRSRSPTRQASEDSAQQAHLFETPSKLNIPLAFGDSDAELGSAFTGPTRQARVSATLSEFTSTIGSDSGKSLDDGSLDYQTDTPYDSFPTRTTRNNFGKRGPHVETIFSDDSPQISSGRSTRLGDLLDEGGLTEYHERHRYSTIEEEGSNLSTPHQSLRDNSVTSTPSARPRILEHTFNSSPPTILRAMPVMPDPDDIDWDAPDDSGDTGLGIDEDATALPTYTSLPLRFVSHLELPHYNGHPGSPQGVSGIDRARLFEWSEAQPSPSHSQTPPRPRTVHGKKDAENRGSRSTGRRSQSNVHSRSHSVPVVPDGDNVRSNATADKFGTWGVRGKPDIENWNEDFEFDEQISNVLEDGRRVDSGHGMFVPKSIREQQESVVANIGLLREWGMLIEELKELRIRAVALDMLNGVYSETWREIDAMIDLADQETEEVTLAPRRSPPSSPGFDYSAFEDALPNIASAAMSREPSVRLPAPLLQLDDIEKPSTSTPADPGPRNSGQEARSRKDSEAVARSVIEALQSKRSPAEDDSRLHSSETKKVPFDTATLRHIVPYVNGLKRRVKSALRETEGLYISPRRRMSVTGRAVREGTDEDSPFRAIFHDPESPSVRRRSRRTGAVTDLDGSSMPDANHRHSEIDLPSMYD